MHVTFSLCTIVACIWPFRHVLTWHACDLFVMYYRGMHVTFSSCTNVACMWPFRYVLSWHACDLFVMYYRNHHMSKTDLFVQRTSCFLRIDILFWEAVVLTHVCCADFMSRYNIGSVNKNWYNQQVWAQRVIRYSSRYDV